MITIKFGSEGGAETVAAEQVGADSFRLLENPVFNCRINYGTTIRVIEDASEKLIMSKIIRASNFYTRQFMLSSSLNEVELRNKIGQPIIDAGGMWEVALGGIASIHIPKNSTFDLDGLFKLNNYYPTEIVDDSSSGQ